MTNRGKDDHAHVHFREADEDNSNDNSTGINRSPTNNNVSDKNSDSPGNGIGIGAGKKKKVYPKTMSCNDNNNRVRFSGDSIALKANREHEHGNIHNTNTNINVNVNTPQKTKFVPVPRRTMQQRQEQEEDKPFEHPAKVKISKEDFFLHLKILCFGIVMFFGSVLYSHLYLDSSKSSASGSASSTSNKKSIMETLQERQAKELELMKPILPTNHWFGIGSSIESKGADADVDVDVGGGGSESEEKVDISGDCSIFLTESSIPVSSSASSSSSNYGLFTMKAFQEGDVIFTSSGSSTAFPVHVQVQAQEQVQEQVQGMLEEELSWSWSLSPHVILLKQHPLFSNVKWTKQAGIVAKKDIQEGEELFLDMQDFNDMATSTSLSKSKSTSTFTSIYHNILHKHDPKQSDYEMVDSILREVMDAIPHKVVYPPQKKNYKQKQKRGEGKLVPSVDAGRILSIVKNAMMQYNETKTLASLIPDTTIEARSVLEAKGSAKFISHRRPVKWIANHGVCYSGLSSESSCSAKQAMMVEEGVNGAFTTRAVKEGDIIETVPLFAIQRGELDSRSTSSGGRGQGDGNCIAAPVDDVVLCPLSAVSNARRGEKCKSNVDECPSDMINAKYQWSELNPVNKDLKDLTAKDFLKVRYVIIITVVSNFTIGLHARIAYLWIILSTYFLVSSKILISFFIFRSL